MSFSIAKTFSHVSPPQPELSCSWWRWRQLRRALIERGQGCNRESGAFLLGKRHNGCARITFFVLYDDLDPHALDSGIVRFDGRYFAPLWELCRERDLVVVADVHVHPGRSDQSFSDQQHPMISQAGHLSLILPNFALGQQPRKEIGIYRYLGQKRWATIPRADRKRFFQLSAF